MSLRLQDNAEAKFTFEDNVLEILKRARCFQSGEGISAFESEANVREEALRRSAKAGYTRPRTKIQNRGYGESNLNVWLRDENGNLIGD